MAETNPYEAPLDLEPDVRQTTHGGVFTAVSEVVLVLAALGVVGGGVLVFLWRLGVTGD